MGCWHQTDLLTNLPIRAGDPVRALVLTPWLSETSHLPLGPSGPTHRYRPVCLPLRGSYNDYGWVEEIAEDAGAATVRRYFAERHQLTDLNLDELDETLDDLVRAAQKRDRTHKEVAEEGEEAEAGPPQQAGYYGVAMMHERTYQALLAATRSFEDWGGTCGEEADAQIAAFRAAIEAKPWGPQFNPDYSSPSAHDAMAAHEALSMNVAGDTIFDYVAEGRDDKAVLAAARDFLLLMNGLRLGRISLQPTSGQGAQHLGFAINQALFEAGIAQIAKAEAEDEDGE